VGEAKKILDKVGLCGERVEMFNLSAAQGQRFAEIATEMAERVARLGPNPLRLRTKTQPEIESVEDKATSKV
jgi:coenzyme F420-reducing hydrogenase delta subunit